jgi:rhamnulokinase
MPPNKKTYSRAFLGSFVKDVLTIKELYGFPNPTIKINQTIYWDIFYLWKEILNALNLSAERKNLSLSGVAFDTWGIDFRLIDKSGKLMYMPVSYRDKRTESIDKVIKKQISESHLYKLTGIRRSFSISTYKPRCYELWEKYWPEYLKITEIRSEKS